MPRACHSSAEAHLLLPTRGDCTPSRGDGTRYASPATDAGGTAEVIGHGQAGSTLPLSANTEVWAAAVMAMLTNTTTYEAYSASAFDRARNTLAWSAWARGIVVLARAAITARSQPVPIAAVG